MRSRNPLQANDLLDIVDFIKNETKYSARIKELQDLEASLQIKMGIVNTLEDAEALVVKHKIALELTTKERANLQKEMAEEKQRQEDIHKAKMADANQKMAEARTFQQSVAAQMNETRALRVALDVEQKQLAVKNHELQERINALSAQQTHWYNKLAALQQILEKRE